VSRDLAEVGISGVARLLATCVMDDAGLERYAGEARPVSDDLPTLEFFGSAARAERALAGNIREIVSERDPPHRLLRNLLRGELTAEERADLDRLYPLENEYLLAYAEHAEGDYGSALERVQRVLAIAPGEKRAEFLGAALSAGRSTP
jgi:hypothetical protein